jgi:hypothetical protein
VFTIENFHHDVCESMLWTPLVGDYVRSRYWKRDPSIPNGHVKHRACIVRELAPNMPLVFGGNLWSRFTFPSIHLTSLLLACRKRLSWYYGTLCVLNIVIYEMNSNPLHEDHEPGLKRRTINTLWRHKKRGPETCRHAMVLVVTSISSMITYVSIMA